MYIDSVSLPLSVGDGVFVASHQFEISMIAVAFLLGFVWHVVLYDAVRWVVWIVTHFLVSLASPPAALSAATSATSCNNKSKIKNYHKTSALL